MCSVRDLLPSLYKNKNEWPRVVVVRRTPQWEVHVVLTQGHDAEGGRKIGAGHCCGMAVRRYLNMLCVYEYTVSSRANGCGPPSEPSFTLCQIFLDLFVANSSLTGRVQVHRGRCSSASWTSEAPAGSALKATSSTHSSLRCVPLCVAVSSFLCVTPARAHELGG